MMVALTEECQRRIKEVLYAHRIERGYLALVHGRFPSASCTLRSQLTRNRGDGLRGSTTEADEDDLREAVTHFKLQEHLGSASLVEARLETGRTHQVRIHLSEKGYPVLGDKLYGSTAVARAAPRLALHAFLLGLQHPLTGEALTFEAPLADDLEILRRRLQREQPSSRNGRTTRRAQPVRRDEATAGIYLTHKPVGPTSTSLVRALAEEAQKNAGRKKLAICHGGALDPFAEGLLILLTGPATRLMDYLHAVPKTYEAEVTWGKETDNGDLLGRVVREGDPTTLDAEKLDAALTSFMGWQEQTPPAHSNKRVDGERAYAKARRGEAVSLPPCRVYLHQARWLSHTLPNQSRLTLACRGGYYVRALARDLGRQLGCGAHLSALRRTAIGPWPDPTPGERVLLRGEALMPWCSSRQLTASEVRDLQTGASLPIGELTAPAWLLPLGFPDPEAPVRAVYAGRLVALLRAHEDRLHPEVLLWPGI